jgi:hypothetical protein
MAIEQKRRVFDEDCVGVVREIGEADYVESRGLQLVLICIVLRRRLLRIDRDPLQVGKFTIGKFRAHGPGVSAGHQYSG